LDRDEYDDIDSDLEGDLKSPANDALERLRARDKPTDEDAKLAEPFYQKLADRERVPFLMVRGGFYLGFNEILYPYFQGGDYVRQITQTEDISPIELDSGGWVGSGGLLYSGDPEGYSAGYDDDDGHSWETTNQQAGYEELFDRSQLRLMLAEVERLEAEIKKLKVKIKRLEDRGETVATNVDLASYKKDLAPYKEDLAFYQKELGLTTHQGRIKSADHEGEKARQRVFQNIKNFYEMLEGKEYGNDESRTIAQHFRKHITYKHGSYRYSRTWKFKYS